VSVVGERSAPRCSKWTAADVSQVDAFGTTMGAVVTNFDATAEDTAEDTVEVVDNDVDNAENVVPHHWHLKLRLVTMT